MTEKNIHDFFKEENINKLKRDKEIKKRIQLIYWLMSPMQAVSDKYPQEILKVHNEFNEQFLKSLSKVKNWVEYQTFIETQNIKSEQSANKIAAILHPQKRRDAGLEPLEEADIYNVCQMLGSSIDHLFKMDYIFVKLHRKQSEDLYNMSVGDHSNYKESGNFTEAFYRGCKWAVEDNTKIGKDLEKYNIENKDFNDYLKDNGFTYIRFPYANLNEAKGFLGYLYYCGEKISENYGIKQNCLGFNQNGLELFTTQSSEAYYVPSLKNINLRLDMINAFYHEHFHSLDHQLLLNINLEEIKNMFGRRGELKFSLASEIKLIDPEKITDGPSKNILMTFNKISDSLIQEHVGDVPKEFSEEEQKVRKNHILSAIQRFLEEIPEKLKIDKTPFIPVISEIVKDFENINNTNEFIKIAEEKLKTLTNEELAKEFDERLKENPDLITVEKPTTPFKDSHANYYLSMIHKIHALYNKMNNNTLFYNYSFINDNNKKGGYFASKPEMLARTAETYFFNKYPETKMTPPEWWETNSYLFYPQNEEIKMVCDVFEKTIDVLKENSQAFEKDLGKYNKKKVYML